MNKLKGLFSRKNSITPLSSQTGSFSSVPDLSTQNVKELQKLPSLPYLSHSVMDIISESENSLESERFTSEYDLNDPLGFGSMGSVFSAAKKSNKSLCAIKVVERRVFDNPSVREEIEILKQLDHEHIIKLHDVFFLKSEIKIVMEYGGVELFELLLENKSFSEANTKYFAKCVVSALKYIHSIGICHRDIKPENILCVFEDGRFSKVKLIDFGFSKITNGPMSSPKVGTVGYKSPEQLRNSTYNELIDIWALGIIIYTMIIGYPPFRSEAYANVTNQLPFWIYFTDDDEYLRSSIINGKVEFPLKMKITQDCKDFMLKSLRVDPMERWSASDAYDSNWLFD